MALRFIDGFDHYSTYLQKWTSVSSNTSPSSGAARFGTAGHNQGSSRWIRKTLDAQPTWTIGTAVKSNDNIADMFLSLMDGTSIQILLYMDRAAGEFRVYRGTFAAQLGSSGFYTVNQGVWNYIEFQGTIHNSTGSYEVRINGTTVLSGSGLDTQATGNASANVIGVGEQTGNNSYSLWFDDLYVCDGTGGSPYDDFLGDVRVDALYPDGNGNSSQFVGSDGNSVDNYLLVDEVTPNDDTDYVESSTIGNKDTYTYSNLVPTSGTVYGVQVLPWVRKTDAGTKEFCSIARLAGTEEDSATKTLSTSYQYLPDIRITKPGGGAWSVSDINSTEFGQKVIT